MAAPTAPLARAGVAQHLLTQWLRALPRRLARTLVRRCTPADPRTAARLLLGTFAVAVVVSLVLPASALADPISDAIEDGVKSVLDVVFQRIMQGLFGRISGELTRELLDWLVAIPNFEPDDQQQFIDGRQESNVDAARQATSMLALGGLTAVMTLSVMRYWISGLSMRGSGGIEAFEGFMRTLLAVGLILLWPESFRVFVALVNSANDTLLNWPSVANNLSGLWNWTGMLAAASFSMNAPIAVIVTIFMVVGFAMLLIGLVLMKIMLTAGTALIYVMMPLALVLWPLPELSWVARIVGRAFVVCLLVPLTWTVIFITFAGLGSDFFTFSGQGNLLDKTIIKPLVTIAMLSLAISIPKSLGKAALLGAVNATGGNVGSGGAGFIGRMSSSMAGRRLDRMLPGGPTPQAARGGTSGGRVNARGAATGAARGAARGGRAGAAAGAARGAAGGGGRAPGGRAAGGRPPGGGSPGGGRPPGGARPPGGVRPPSPAPPGGARPPGGVRPPSAAPPGGARPPGGGRPPGGARPPGGGGAGAGAGAPGGASAGAGGASASAGGASASAGAGGAGAGAGGAGAGAGAGASASGPSMGEMHAAADRWASAGGPPASTVHGALDSLGDAQRGQVAGAAATMTPEAFRNEMFSHATDPANSRETQGKYFVLGTAGGGAVQAASGGGDSGGGGGAGGGGDSGGGGGASGGGGDSGGGGALAGAAPAIPAPQPPGSGS